MASRTDRGVSARANALLLPSPLDGHRLLRALNGIAPDLYFTGAHAVEEGFHPRRASYRTYRYLESAIRHDPDRWRELAPRFIGRMDARSFGRGLPADRPTWRDISAIDVRVEGPWMVVEITAPAFVWGMVRKVIAALRSLEAGQLSVREVDEAIAGTHKLTLSLAEPEGLILWEVGYPFPFEVAAEGLTPHQERYWVGEREATEWRAALVARVAPSVGRPAQGTAPPASPSPRERAEAGATG